MRLSHWKLKIEIKIVFSIEIVLTKKGRKKNM